MRKTSFIVLMYLLLLSGSVYGAVFNVTNPSEFQTALTTAQANNENDTINVAAGTYNISSTLTYMTDNGDNHHTLTITGAGIEQTILDGGNNVQIMYLTTDTGYDGGDSSADITLNGIKFQNGNSSSPEIPPPATLSSKKEKIKRTYGKKLSGTQIAIFFDLTPGAAGIISAESNIRVENCMFSHNTGVDYGGGVAFECYLGSIAIINSIFNNNNVISSESFATGGGADLYTDYGTITLVNNDFYENTSDYGGGVYLWLSPDATSNNYNNIFWSNETRSSDRKSLDLANGDPNGDDLYVSDGGEGTYATINLYNNNFSGNADFVNAQSEDLYIENINNNYFQANNIQQDPLFVEADAEDFHIQGTSPCINVGLNSAPSISSIDYEGEDRIMGGTVDIGADEFTYYTVTANGAGVNGGTMTSTGIIDATWDGFVTSGDNSEDVASGSGPFTITATATQPGVTVTWSGSCDVMSGNGTTVATCTVNNPIESDKNITATFAINSYTITVNGAGVNGGTMTSPRIIDATWDGSVTSGDNTETVAYGSGPFTITATSTQPGVTVTWSGSCDVMSGNGTTVATCTINNPVTSNKNVTATFALNSHTITVNGAGANGGTMISPGIINASWNGSTISGDNTEIVAYGSGPYTITATSTQPGVTVTWSGSCDVMTGNGTTVATCTINNPVTSNKNVTATFTLNTYTISVNGSGVNGGTITCPGIINATWNGNTTSGDNSETVPYGSGPYIITASAALQNINIVISGNCDNISGNGTPVVTCTVNSVVSDVSIIATYSAQQQNTSSILFPYINSNKGNVSTIISVINAKNASYNSGSSTKSSGALHYRYFHKKLDAPSWECCEERNFCRPTTDKDLVSFDVSGYFDSGNQGQAMFGDATNYNSGAGAPRFDLGNLGFSDGRRGYLVVTHADSPQSCQDMVNGEVLSGGLLDGEAMVVDIVNGAAWSYRAIQNTRGGVYTFVRTNDDPCDSQFDALLENDYQPAAIYPPDSFLTRIFVTPLRSENDSTMITGQNKTKLLLTDSSGVPGVYDRNENFVSGGKGVDICCVAGVSLYDLASSTNLWGSWINSQGGWSHATLRDPSNPFQNSTAPSYINLGSDYAKYYYDAIVIKLQFTTNGALVGGIINSADLIKSYRGGKYKFFKD